MRYLVLILLGALLLWIVYILIANRRKQPYDNRSSGDSGGSSGDSGSYNSSHCDSSDSGCSGGDGGGGD